MAEEAFTLRVYSPEGLVLEEPVISISLQSADGQIGILSEHARYVGVLGTGVLSFVVESSGETGRLVIAGGFCKVAGNNVTILADSVVLEEDVAGKSFAEEKKKLEELLSTGDSQSRDWAHAKEEFLKIQAIEELCGANH